MNKNDKFIKKLSRNERAILLATLQQIERGHVMGLNIKKLKGYDNYFRVRKGKVRIIFNLDINGKIVVKQIGWRNDNTYNL